MKKILVLLITILLSLSLVGCDQTDDPERIVSIYRQEYLNVTEQWCINTRNGYRAYSVVETYIEESDEYTVVIKIGKPLKESEVIYEKDISSN